MVIVVNVIKSLIVGTYGSSCILMLQTTQFVLSDYLWTMK